MLLREVLTRRLGPCICAAAVAVLLGCGHAGARVLAKTTHEPSAAEKRAIVAAVQKTHAGSGITASQLRIVTSSVQPGWAAVRWETGRTIELYHHTNGRWQVVGELVQFGQPLDGLCAAAPANVVEDLFHVRCPSFAALHARRASKGEVAQLSAAFRRSPLEPSYGPFRLTFACISRLDPRWAAADAVFPDTSEVVWFKRSAGRWRFAASQATLKARLPSRPIILSLADCVRYNAAEYGA